MGAACEKLGKYAEALQYHEQALTMHQAPYEENQPEVAQLLSNLGKAYERLGNY